MKPKTILGLDVGTNSVGAALITVENFGESGAIKWIGSRIVPLDGDSLMKFENGGQVETKAANRRRGRGSRRLKQRYKLRRARLVKVLKALGWMPPDFPENFEKEGAGFNINRYLLLSEETRKEAYAAFGTGHFSEDWLVYFLRRKALTQEITLPELSRILYMMNQRRGFKSSRKEVKVVQEEEEKWPKHEKWNEIVTVSSVSEVAKEKDKTIYRIKAACYEADILRKEKPDWEGREMELEISRKTTKGGEVTYSFKMPDKSDWERKKEALHKDFYKWQEDGLCRTIGEYFLEQLLADKNYRIRQHVIDRKLYREELEAIWQAQSKFHPELSSKEKLPELARLMYAINSDKQKELAANDLLYLFASDIIYYQRPLKSQKHLIDVCRFEQKTFEKDGIKQIVGVKVAPRSSPEAQEIRIWQDIHNLRIFDTNTYLEKEVTESVLDSPARTRLFELFDNSGEVTLSAVLKVLGLPWKDKEIQHRINLFANRDKLKGNETKAVFHKVFKKHDYEKEGEQWLRNPETFYKLWHALYSLTEEQDLKTAFLRQGLPPEVAAHLAKLPELPKSYSAYSSKAIKKMLPLLRTGPYWTKENIDTNTQKRIEKLVTAEWDEAIDDRTREQALKRGLDDENNFKGLPIWLASYVVYGRHSEQEQTEKYSSYEQIDIGKLIKPGSMRNPFVETIIRETLALVKDICAKYGMPDEIHVELARELKKSPDEKAEISKAQNENNAEKERIRTLLQELKRHHTGNPQSLADIEKFRLWKANGGWEASQKFNELFDKKNAFVKTADIERYRLWADQHHCSPYTGKAISLTDLFDKSLYEVEHIFPKSRFFDDSFANKIICETGVNKQKDKEIARIFIQQQEGIPFIRGGKRFITLSDEDYVTHCKRYFKNKKLRNLLAESIPEEFVSRQLNDTRHISRRLAEMLAPVAQEKEGIIFTGGSITSELKEKWGLNKVWKELLLPRFERLSDITGEPMILKDEKDSNKFHFAKDYKRVDHRHHALDALIIAATQRSHIQYLNTLNALSEEQKNKSGLVQKDTSRKFVQPWPTFTKDAKDALLGVIVSHKAVNRIVSTPFNKYLKWEQQADGSYKKVYKKQEQPTAFGKSWTAVRRSMFKEPQGIIYLKEVVKKKTGDTIAIQAIKDKHENRKGQKPADYIYDQTVRPQVKALLRRYKGDVAAAKASLKKNPLKDEKGDVIEQVEVAVFNEYTAKRVALDDSFTAEKIRDSIPYGKHEPDQDKKQTLPKQLLAHLKDYNNDPKIAFIGEGLEALHKKLGFPLQKVTTYESVGNKINFQGRYYEADKGSNVFFVIKEKADSTRKMDTLPLMDAIKQLANKEPLVEEEEGWRWFTLSPNELVYVPDEGEDIRTIDWTKGNKLFGKVYKVVSFSKKTAQFIPHYIASAIMPYDRKAKTNGEIGQDNKSIWTWNGDIKITDRCIKLKIDRLGNIQPA